MKGKKNKAEVALKPCPCYACPERGIQRRLGVCNHGLGICDTCLEYRRERSERKRESVVPAT